MGKQRNLGITASGAAALAQNLLSGISNDEAKIRAFPAIKRVLIMENILK